MLYNIYRSREWRNRQTRTFEGRVFPTYGFKSRLPHQKKTQDCFNPESFSVKSTLSGGLNRIHDEIPLAWDEIRLDGGWVDLISSEVAHRRFHPNSFGFHHRRWFHSCFTYKFILYLWREVMIMAENKLADLSIGIKVHYSIVNQL